jgi:hypothetical protein
MKCHWGALTWGSRRCAVATPGYGRNPLQGLGGWGGSGWICELSLSGNAFGVLAVVAGVTGGGRCARPPATLCDPDRGRSWPGRTGCGRTCCDWTGCGRTGCGWTGRRRLCRGRTVFALGQWDRNRSTPKGSTCPGSSRVRAFRATKSYWLVGPTNRVVWTRFPARWDGLGEGLARWAGRRFPVWGGRCVGRAVRDRRKRGWFRMVAGGSQPFQG